MKVLNRHEQKNKCKKCKEARAPKILAYATVGPKILKVVKTKFWSLENLPDFLFWHKLSSWWILEKTWTDSTNYCKTAFVSLFLSFLYIMQVRKNRIIKHLQKKISALNFSREHISSLGQSFTGAHFKLRAKNYGQSWPDIGIPILSKPQEANN